MTLISEFQPNPAGTDPTNQTVELFGTPGAAFTGWLLSIESDAGNAQLGTVDRATEVSGTFDSDGLLEVTIPDLENPGFTLVLAETFTGTAGVTDLDTDNDGVADELSTVGTVLDAIGVPNGADDEATLYAAQFGGTDFAFTGDSPELVFRAGSNTVPLAVNELGVSTDVVDPFGIAVPATEFTEDPTLSPTFGAVNPDVTPLPGEVFTLQILHASDLEGGIDAIDNAPNFAAVVDALERDAAEAGASSILLSAGDNYIPGPFFNAGGDAALTLALEGLSNELFDLIDTSVLGASDDLNDDGFFDNDEIEQFLAETSLDPDTVYTTDVNGDGLVDYFEEIDGFEGRVDIAIMNLLQFDVAAVGNHEFDAGTDAFENIINFDSEEGNSLSTGRYGTANFLQEVDTPGAQFPYLSANLDFSSDFDVGPLFQDNLLPTTAFASDLESARVDLADPTITGSDSNDQKIAPSTIIEQDGERIGVVGATTQLVNTISSTGTIQDLTSPGVNDMAALAALLQPEVDELIAEGINKVIIVSHLQQFALEVELAGLMTGVDVIIAGGSDTISADDQDRLRPGDEADQPYPRIVTDADGGSTAIVSTDGEYSYVGRLVVEFNADGEIITDSIVEDESGAFATDDQGVIDAWGDVTGATGLALEESQEVAAVPDGPATGSFEVYNDGNDLYVSGTFSGIASGLLDVSADGEDPEGNPIDAAHLHIGAAGTNGPVVRALTVTDLGDGTFAFTGDFTLTADELAEFEAGNFYVNIHSVDFPGGELRGQIDAAALGAIPPSADAVRAFSETATDVGNLADGVTAVVTEQDAIVFGESTVYLNGERSDVRTQETNFGNLTADANLAAAQEIDGDVVISLKNGGGIRAAIGQIVDNGDGTFSREPTEANPLSGKEANEISQLDIENALRFNNGLSVVELTPEELKIILEHAVAETAEGSTPGQFPQVGGLQFSFDPDATAQVLGEDGVPTTEGERVQNVALLDEDGTPSQLIIVDGEVAEGAPETLKLVTLDFLAGGGDGYPFEAFDTPVDLGVDEQTALADFLTENFPASEDGTSENAFAIADAPASEDTRIQNLSVRDDTVGSFAPDAPVATEELTFEIFSELDSGIGSGGSEVVAVEDGLLYITNGEQGRIDIFPLVEGTAGPAETFIDLTSLDGFDSLQSVDVKNGVVAVAVARPTETETVLGTEVETSQPGFVALYSAATLELLATIDVGTLPDQLVFNDDGSKLLVAGEGEKNDDSDNDDNPLGTIATIHINPDDVASSEVTLSDFTDFNGLEDEAREAGVRVQEGVSIAEDVEPEYITISPDGETAYVSLQENNAIAVLDIESGEIEDIFSLGLADHSQEGFEIDPNDNGVIQIGNFDNLVSFRMADAIAAFEVGGTTYVATANEGDSRGFDEARVEDLIEDDLLDPNVDTTGLERLEVSTIDGDTDGDGDIDVIHSFSSRSFSIFDEEGNLVFDSGSQFEAIVAELAPERFNDDDGDDGEDRSDAKGPEPEAIAVGEVGGRTYAFIGLERDSGIMIYNVEDPANATFVNYIPPLHVDNAAEGEIAKHSPEVIAIIDPEDSPTGNSQIAVSYEISGTTIVYDLASDDPITPIYTIQGEGHISSLVGETVKTTGIVTAVDFNGYYVQDATGDRNAATSDGIFVFTGNGNAADMSVGDAVELTGTVGEFIPGGASTGNLSITQISEDTVEIVSQGNALPEAVLLGADGRPVPTDVVISSDELPVNLQNDPGAFDPEEDGIDFYETLEGMRVTIDDPVVIDPTNGFNETWVVADDGEGVTSGSQTGGLNERGLLEINADQDGLGDLNPEKIQIQYDAFFDLLPDGFTPPDLTVGDDLSDVTGVVSYSFGNFEVLVTDEFSIEEASDLEAETTELTGTEGELTVATYNVFNVTSGAEADDADQITALAEQIVNNLSTPDIIALQEIQDDNGSAEESGSFTDDNENGDFDDDEGEVLIDDGVLGADETLQALIDAIVAAGGPEYAFESAVVDEFNENGGVPGGNIRNAFLWNPDRVTADEFVTLESDVLADLGVEESDAFDGSRDPLLGTFTFDGEQITFLNNHFSSRFGSDPIFGGVQPFEQAGEAEREAQAKANNAVVDALLADDPSANVVVLGDLNTFEFTDEVSEDLAGVGDEQVLTNLTDILEEDAAYTFVFDGNAQILDHILVTDNLLELAEVDIVHVNNDFPDFASDHEPVVARFNFDGLTDQFLAGTDESETIEGGLGADTITGGAGDDELFGFRGADEIDGGSGNDFISGGRSDDVLVGGANNDTIEGGREDDLIDGVNGADEAIGNRGDDTMLGGNGDDVLDAGRGADFIAGENGNDTLIGWRGDDTIIGGDGMDVIEGGANDDVLIGGADADTFLFLDARNGRDLITDFDVEEDLIGLAVGIGEADTVQDFLDASVQIGSDLFYDAGDDNRNTITLLDVEKSLLTVDNFVFF